MNVRIPMLFGALSLIAGCDMPVSERDADLDPVSAERGERDTATDTGDSASEEDESVREDRATLEGLNAELLATLGLDRGAITSSSSAAPSLLRSRATAATATCRARPTTSARPAGPRRSAACAPTTPAPATSSA